MTANQPTKANQTDWLRQLPSSIAILDKKFHLVDASENWYHKLGLASDDTLGKDIFEILPRFSEDWKTKLRYALDGLKEIQIIDKIVTDKGATKDYIWYLNPWQDRSGKIVGVVLNVKDVTQTKELQFELARMKNLLKQKAKLAKIGSWEYDVEKGEVFLSPDVRDIFKVKNGSQISMEDAINFYEKGHSRDRIEQVIGNALKSGLPWDENLQLVSRNNEITWVNTIGRPKFKNGKCARIIGTVQDITDKTENLQVPSSASNSYEHTDYFMMAPTAMAVTNFATGEILEVNDAMTELTGYEKEELVGKTYQGFQVFTKSSSKSSTIQQLRKKGRYDSFDLETIDKKGKKLKLRIKGNLLLDSQDEQCVISTIEDVSYELNKTENLRMQLHDANEHIEKLVNFNHMVSHNLKGHATNFSLLLGFLENEENEGERKKLVSILKHGTDNLAQTIKGLREIVTIRNNYNMKREPLVLNDFIYRGERSLAGLLKQEQAKIINEIDDSLEIKAIPVYLESIITNCISNAIRFRKPNKNPLLIFSAKVEKEYTILSIEDNGIGMDLEKHGEKLFGLYETLGNQNETRGMGLYLTKYQVELMKGKIEVQSKEGEGTTFNIFFPNR